MTRCYTECAGEFSVCLEKQQLLRTLAQEDEVVKRQLLMPAAVVEKAFNFLVVQGYYL